MIHNEAGGTRGEPLVKYHRKLIGKELSYLEVHDQSVLEDLAHILGAYNLLSYPLQWISDEGLVTFFIMEKRRRDG
jgi:hypothetical protein